MPRVRAVLCMLPLVAEGMILISELEVMDTVVHYLQNNREDNLQALHNI